jgi:hypothetical protein
MVNGWTREKTTAHQPVREELRRRHKSNKAQKELKRNARETTLPQPNHVPKHFMRRAVKACQIGNSSGVGEPFALKPGSMGRSKSMCPFA